MRTSTIARIGAVAFVAVVITVTALEMRDVTPRPLPSPAAASVGAQADPLRGELARCQAIGAAAADDGVCLRAWAENRRRFLAPGARPQAAIEPALPDSASAGMANDSANFEEKR